MKLSRIIFSAFFLIVFVGIIAFTSLVGFAADYWWFEETGFTQILLRSLTAQALTGLAAGLITAIFLITNFLWANHSKIEWIGILPASLTGQPISVTNKFIARIIVLLSLIIGLFTGIIGAASWETALKYISAVPFGVSDPIFNTDLGFYIFTLPFYSLVSGLAKFVITITLIGTAGIYILRGKLHFRRLLGMFTNSNKSDDKRLFDSMSGFHIGILFFLLFAISAIDTYLARYDLLYSQTGPVLGASYTDVNIMIPILNTLAIVYLIAAATAFLLSVSGRIFPFLATLVLLAVVNFASLLVPEIVQRFIVAPNELSRETPYIKNNIQATREAYNLDTIEESEIQSDKPLTASDIEENNLTIKNVRLWDRDPLLSTFSQIQEIRTYYEFISVDNDRYNIDGEIRQIMLSPRELSADSLPNKNWINEHLTFTHGFGMTAGPVNQVTPEGLPVLFVKNIPPVAEKKELAVSQPRIYFGEIANDYIVVNTNSREFDYPKGEENVYTKYDGSGGVRIDSFWKKLMLSLNFNSMKLFLSGDITDQSRIMYNRNIKERVAKVAPFLTYDRDPYSVIADGKIYWILDAYTLTDRYPYSQRVDFANNNANYIRNSVKAVVDAYNGKVSLYIADSNDPIVKTYAKMFPGAFQSMDKLPEKLKNHLRYPEDIFSAQSAVYTIYHMTEAQNFYNKEDQWEIPAIAGEEVQADGTQTSAMSPRHLIMKLPNGSEEEFILMLPFTPRAKDNLAAWMVARNDGENYGKLGIYKFPKDKLVFGPKQIMSRISQDAEISRQISLWDQRGSQVIQGQLLVIPIENSLIYVRPLYLKAETGKIPELKRVIVAYENKIAMEETLEEGLGRIFSGLQTQPETQTTTAPDEDVRSEENVKSDEPNNDLLNDAKAAYEAAITAQRNGEWTKYGEEIKKLGEILSNIEN